MENRDKDVENFIGGLVELAGYDTVDGDDNKYIRICSKGDDNGAIESIRTAEGEKPLAIYGSLANDAAIVNPFVEGNSNVALDNWIYTSQNGQLGAIMQSVIRKILNLQPELVVRAVRRMSRSRISTAFLMLVGMSLK